MDNRKKALTGSGWSEGTERGFRQEPEIRKTSGKLGTGQAWNDGSNRRTGSGLALVPRE